MSVRFAIEDYALYDEDQPRVPSGNPDGGQWTSTGGSQEVARPSTPRGTDDDAGEAIPIVPHTPLWAAFGHTPKPEEQAKWDKTVKRIEAWAKTEGLVPPWIEPPKLEGERVEPTPRNVRRWMAQKRLEVQARSNLGDQQSRTAAFEAMGVPHDDADRLARWMLPRVTKPHLVHEIAQNFPLEARRRADAIGEASQPLIHVRRTITEPSITTNPAEIVDRGLWAEREMGVRLAAANVPKTHWDMMTTPSVAKDDTRFTALTGIHLVAHPDEAPSSRAGESLAKPNVAGNYRDPHITINITRIGNRRAAASVATHEIGHAFHAALKRARTPNDLPFEHRVPTQVTFYGMKNPNEAFAEAYAMYGSPGGRAYMALRAPAAHEFMRRLYEEPEENWLQYGDKLVKRGKVWKIQRRVPSGDEGGLLKTIELDEGVQLAEEQAEDCRWVTINGHPVCIEGPAPQERGTRDLPRTGRAVPHKFEKAKHVPAVPIALAREETITDSETGKPVKVWVGTVKKGEPVHVYRAISSLDELKDAAREGGWQSHGRFVVEGLEGRTQFTADPDAAVAHGQMVGQKPFKYLVQADVQGLRYKAWIVPPNQEEMAIEASMGAGLGIDEPVPLDRIQKVWRIEGKATDKSDDLRLGKEIHPVEWQGAKALETAKPIGASVRQPKPQPLTLYHATSRKHLMSILKTGLVQQESDEDLGQPGGVWAGSYDVAKEYMDQIGRGGVLMRITIPPDQVEALVREAPRTTPDPEFPNAKPYQSWLLRNIPPKYLEVAEETALEPPRKRVAKPRVKIRYTLAEEETKADDEECQWVTIRGNHVCIKKATGEITKGPVALVGRTITDVAVEEGKKAIASVMGARPAHGVWTGIPKEVPATPEEIVGSTPGKRFPGGCYWKAGEYMLHRKVRGSDLSDTSVALVHGTVGDGVNKIGHAWVEVGDKIFDGTKQQFFDKADYLKKMNAVVEHRYTPVEAFKWMARQKHYGPWEGTAGVTAGPAPKRRRRAA